MKAHQLFQPNSRDKAIIELVRSAPHGFHVTSSGSLDFNNMQDREAKIEKSFKYLKKLTKNK